MSSPNGDRRVRWRWLFGVGCACYLGCAPPAVKPVDAVPQTDDVAPNGGVEVQLTAVDRAAYDAVVAGLRGKVVLVDFWASWCVPCLKQLPHTTALAAERAGDDLAVLTLCMDNAEQFAEARSLLSARGGAHTTNLLSKEGGGSAAMEAYQIDSGALPHYKLYNRDGKVRRTFSVDPAAETQFTEADVDAAVAELMAE